MRYKRAMTGIPAVLLAVVLMVFALPGTRGASLIGASADASHEAAASDATLQGIKVHGDWMIDVLDPDGTLAQHVEFQNSLQSAGAGALVSVLARNSSVGHWYITLSGSPNACQYDATTDFPCWIAETGNTGTGPVIFKTLNVSTEGSYGTAKLVLSGSATVANSASISQVDTVNAFCSSATPPNAPCDSIGGTPITRKTLASPISVSPGQQVLVTVKISFS